MAPTSTDKDEGGPRPRIGAAWIRVATIGGVGVYVDLTLPLLLALLAWSGLGDRGPGELVLTLLALVVFVSVHEAGHAWAARRLGRQVGGIYLHLFPATYLDAGPPEDEIRIALAGPLANLALALLLLAGYGVFRGLAPLAEPSAWAKDPWLLAIGVNLLMFFLNLMPALPADGGRALCALLTPRIGAHRARRVVALVGIGLGLVVAAWALALPWARGEATVLWLALPALYVAWVSARSLAAPS